MARQYLKHQIGSGKSTFFFLQLDVNWNPDRPLMQKYGQRIIYDLASHLNPSALRVFACDRHCQPASAEALVDIQKQMFRPFCLN